MLITRQSFSVGRSPLFGLDGDRGFVIATGPREQGPVKASRLALMQSLVIWTLARLHLANRSSPDVISLTPTVNRLTTAIDSSRLLLKSGDWADELMPHVAFYPGNEWRDA